MTGARTGLQGSATSGAPFQRSLGGRGRVTLAYWGQAGGAGPVHVTLLHERKYDRGKSDD